MTSRIIQVGFLETSWGEISENSRRLAQRLKFFETIKAGAPGVEPRSTDSKSGVLPLHHAPMGLQFASVQNCITRIQRHID